METNLFKSINLIRCVSGANLNLFRYAAKSCDSQGVVTAMSYGASDEHPMSIRSASDGNSWYARVWKYAAMLLCFLTLGITNAWGSATYKLQLKTVTQNNTGSGRVYASENTAAPEYSSYYTSKNPAYDAVTAGSKEYYLWAVPTQRGVVFDEWTTSSTSSGSCTAGSSTLTDANKMQGAKVKVNAPTNASGTDTYTTTATVTANWKNQYSKVAVTYATPVDGKYRVTYEYSYLNTSTNALETGFTFDMDGSSAARSEDSYNNDVITLQSLDGVFEGWYNGSTLLSKNNPYTYVAPAAGGSVTISAHYTHVDKYYGKLTASIAEIPYSMPGGGTIFIANDPDVSGTYSADAQSVSNETYGKSQNYYLHAQPNDKRYVFRGWYSNPECTGTALSTNADYTYTFTASSMNSASPTTGNVYAAFDFNLYYMQVEAEPAVPGLGMVLVKDDNSTTPVYTEYTTHSEQFLYAYRLAPTANAYLYAKPKYGYKFSGWYDNPDCTGTAKSTANPYTYAATGTSTDPMNPTITKLYAKFIEDATTVNITYNKPDQKGEYTASVLDIAEVDDEFVWTFTEVFTSVGKSANTTQAQHKTDVLRLEAQPKAGYGVTSWTEGSTPKTTLSHIYETAGTAAKTLSVAFGDAKPFLVCSTTTATTGTAYATLAEALANLGTNKKIVVVQDAYVPAGDYTIPSGVTLLVPYEDTYKVEEDSPTSVNPANASGCKPYVTLTLASGVIINVNGAMSVATKQFATNTTYTQTGVRSAYGYVYMEKDSKIQLNSGSNLYAWGYISGEGEVTAKNGSNVYEMFQFQDFRGGTRTSGMAGNSQKVFPFQQYYIQNIETMLHLEYGATEYVRLIIFMDNKQFPNTVKFVGTGTSGAMFSMSNGSLSKKYDRATDRINYKLDGTATLSSISLKFTYILSVTVNSKDYVLPLNGNMTIDLTSGSSFTLSQDMSALPGTIISVPQGAKVVVPSGKNMFIYDKAEWLGKGCVFNNVNLKQLAHVGRNNTDTYGAPFKRTVDQSAKIVVDGTLEIAGAMYTTATGADICSNGSGTIVFKGAAGTENKTYQDAGNSGYQNIPITAAQLHNGDDSYTATAGAVANDQFIYSKSQEKWLKNPKVVSWNANGGTTEASTLAYSQGSFVGELPAAYKDGYTLKGWYTAANGGTQIEPTTKVTANATYYAHWTPKSYTITYRDNGGAAFTGTHIDTPTPHPTTHTFGTATTLNGVNNKTGYTFDGWYRTPSCSGAVVTSIAASECKNITLYAKWTPTKYTITYHLNDGSVSTPNPTSYTIEDEAFTLNNPTKTGYVFAGWTGTGLSDATENVTIATGSTGDRTYTATWTINQYTLTVLSANEAMGTVTGGGTYDYNTPHTITATPNTGFKFVKWNDDNTENPRSVTIPAENVTYTATFDYDIANYTVKHWQQNIDNDEYTEVVADRQTDLSGTIGESTAAEANTYEGFTAQSIVQQTIALENTVVDIYYDRKTYTITWVDGNNVIETDENVAYGAIPSFDGTTPTKDADVQYSYTFAGWSPAVASVTKDATYTAQFNAHDLDLHVTEQEQKTINEDVTITTTTVENGGTLTVGNGNEDITLQSNTIIVESGGQLDVADNGSIKADVFIIQATTEEQGEEDAKEEVLVSGELSETGSKTLGAIYYDLIRKQNFLARVWYAVAVPWAVEVPTYNNGGVYIKQGEEFVQQRLGATFDLITYNGHCRATQGASADCWVYLEDEIAGGADAVMVPGKLYMIYLTEETSTIRFKKKAREAIHTNSLTVSACGGSGNDANWNGIANPATYRAYMGVSVSEGGLVQKFVPGTQPRDGGSYLPLDLKDPQAVGQPFFAQVDPNAGTTVVANRNNTNPSASAPRRLKENSEPEARYAISIAANGKLADRLYIQTAEEKEDEYIIGKDMSKMSVSSRVAQIWVNRYESKLCLNTAVLDRDKASYPLGIYAPQAGEYKIFAPADIETNDNIYLTLDGRVIWNLTMAPYYASLEQGTTNRYGLRLVRNNAPAVSTDVENLKEGTYPAAQKIIIEDKVYILRGEKLYTITGQSVQ